MADGDNKGLAPNAALERGFEKILSPFQQFVRDQTTSSIVLIASTVLALLIANSPLADSYYHFLHVKVGIFAGDWLLSLDIKHWINEGLMTIFFFVLGMEIKREVLVGDIKERRLLVPVAFAALGGMLAPSLIYLALNQGTGYEHGWGIPMATDTAFAVGVLALLGGRVPAAAFTFLVALAIIDDLGAILVIAFFYSQGIDQGSLLLCGALLILLVVINLIGIRSALIYLAVGLVMWVAMLNSGIHSTVVGILIAVTVPARPKRQPVWLVGKVSGLVRRFERLQRKNPEVNTVLEDVEQQKLLESLRSAAEKAGTPLRRWERVLEFPVALLVLPIFAFANAGIALHWDAIGASNVGSVTVGVMLGLVVGKGLGIPLFTWIALRCGLGDLPEGVRMRHVIGLGFLGGVGFTMSLFISELGFDSSLVALDSAKLGILLASLLSGCLGYIWLRLVSRAG